MIFTWFVFCAGLCLLLPVGTKASKRSEEICRTGPFSFEGKDSWNTTGTRWTVKKDWRGRNSFMTLSFRQFRGKNVAPVAYVESPPLCSLENGTYSLAFRYSIGGLPSFTSCYLSVGLLRGRDGESGGGTTLHYEPLWRSSGGTFSMFHWVTPSVTFRSCSSEFKLVFEGSKTESGLCGIFADSVSFDDISFTYAADPKGSRQKQLCPGDEPGPNKHHGGGGGGRRKSGWTLSTDVVIAIIVAIAIVIIIIACLVAAVANTRRRRRSRGISNESRSNVGYGSFANEAAALAPRRQGNTPDYEPMDNEDSLAKPALLPSGSGGSDDEYNRLHVTGRGAAARTQDDDAHGHYDHFDGDTAYQDLHRENRARDAQRKYMAENYSHI